MVTYVILGLVLAAAFVGFALLYRWTRRMESDVDYDELGSGERDERLKNTARLAIALSTTQPTNFG